MGLNYEQIEELRDKIRPKREKKPIEFKVIGLVSSVAFQRAKRSVQAIRWLHSDRVADPNITGLLETDWLDFLNKKRLAFGGRYWEPMNPVAVYKKGKYIGDDIKFIEFLYKKFDYHDDDYQYEPERLIEEATLDYCRYFVDRPEKRYVYLVIGVDSEPVGRMLCELHSDILPRTCENFRSLCTRELAKPEQKMSIIKRKTRSSRSQYFGKSIDAQLEEGMEEKSEAEEQQSKLPALLGEEELNKLLALLGAEALSQLLALIGEEELNKLLALLGAEALSQLLALIGVEDLSKLLSLLGVEGLSKLLALISVEDLSKLLSLIGVEGLSKLLALLGAEGLSKLLALIGVEELSKLLALIGEDELSKLLALLGVEDLGKLLALLGVEGLSKLLALLGVDELSKLLTLIGVDGLSKLLALLGEEGLSKLLALLGVDGLSKLLALLGDDALEKLLAILAEKGIEGLLDLLREEVEEEILTVQEEQPTLAEQESLQESKATREFVFESDKVRKLHRATASQAGAGVGTPLLCRCDFELKQQELDRRKAKALYETPSLKELERLVELEKELQIPCICAQKFGVPVEEKYPVISEEEERERLNSLISSEVRRLQALLGDDWLQKLQAILAEKGLQGLLELLGGESELWGLLGEEGFKDLLSELTRVVRGDSLVEPKLQSTRASKLPEGKESAERTVSTQQAFESAEARPTEERLALSRSQQAEEMVPSLKSELTDESLSGLQTEEARLNVTEVSDAERLRELEMESKMDRGQGSMESDQLRLEHLPPHLQDITKILQGGSRISPRQRKLLQKQLEDALQRALEAGDIALANFIRSQLNALLKLSETEKSRDDTLSTLVIPPLSYQYSPIHRIVKMGWIESGYLPEKDYGAMSIYGPTFADECFGIKHDRRGILSMMNNGRHSNSSLFFITLKSSPWMDMKYVAFGRIVEGINILDTLEALETYYEKPKKDVRILSCGELDVNDILNPMQHEDSEDEGCDEETLDNLEALDTYYEKPEQDDGIPSCEELDVNDILNSMQHEDSEDEGCDEEMVMEEELLESEDDVEENIVEQDSMGYDLVKGDL